MQLIITENLRRPQELNKKGYKIRKRQTFFKGQMVYQKNIMVLKLFPTRAVQVKEVMFEFVKKTAKILRQELLNSPDIYSSSPPTKREVLPPLAEAFLSIFLTSRGYKSSRLTQMISSLARDLAYSASFGTKRVHKQVQLGICVERKSRSVDLIRWLNRLGHSISYDQINSIENKLAEHQANRREPRKFVPYNIQSSVSVAFLYDNCDHNSESIYNITLHGTNGTII